METIVKKEFKDLPDKTTPFKSEWFNDFQDKIIANFNEIFESLTSKGIVYSNEEQIIGIDENGKKVYKRSFSGTTGSGEYITFATDYNLNNITIKKAYGSVKGQTGGVAIGGYVNSNYFVGLFIHQQELQIYYGPSLKNGNYNVTIEYTKTTD